MYTEGSPVSSGPPTQIRPPQRTLWIMSILSSTALEISKEVLQREC